MDIKLEYSSQNGFMNAEEGALLKDEEEVGEPQKIQPAKRAVGFQLPNVPHYGSM